MSDINSPFRTLTPKLCLQLAAPHTWSASIVPVLLATVLCAADTGLIPVVSAMILLAISVLMQSAVNTINDYFDYVKGTDTEENQDDPTDAVLVYNDVEPASARNLAIAFIALAFLLGIYLIIRAGWIPLVIALVGAAIVFLYSGGRTPVSYLPIGELVSGFTMGGLITLASYQVLTRSFDWMVLAISLPVIIGIALIMFTNNTCDIEKDIPAKRKTLSVLLGRNRSRTLYKTLLVVWVVAIIAIVALRYQTGCVLLPFMLLALYPPAKAMFSNPLIAETRGPAMGQITTLNIVLGAFYAACIALQSSPLLYVA